MKLDREGAYKVLGVKEDATRDDILKKYDILLKKYRLSSDEISKDVNNEPSIEKITTAYNLLMGIDETTEEVETRRPNPILKKLNIDEKKAGNFIHYYKYHFIIGIALIAVFIYMLQGCVNRVEPDLRVAFMGEFYINETEAVEQEIKTMMPELKAVEINSAFISDKIDGQQSYAGLQKAMVLMAAGDIDIFIMDKGNFERYAEQGAFISLDDIATELNIDRSTSENFIFKLEGENAEHLYGIDISGNSIIKNTGIETPAGEAVAAIRADPQHPEAAVRLVKQLIK